MDWFVLIVNEYRHIFSLLIADLLLVLPSLEKRGHFALRITLCVVCFCAFSTLYALFYKLFINQIYLSYISISWYFIIAILSGVVIKLCFKLDYTCLLWVMLAAYAAEHFVYVMVIEIIFVGFAGGVVNFWIQLAAYCATCCLVYWLFYKIYKPNIKYIGSFYFKDTGKNRILISAIFIVFIAATMLNQLNAVGTPGKFNYIGGISDLINCLFVLLVQFIGLTVSRVNIEKQLSDKLYEEERKQYLAFKNNVDYINIKYHDLKHEIAKIKDEGMFYNAAVEEIEDNLSLYEAFADTGNETLDILLTAKNRFCLQEGIAFSCLAEAGALNVMDGSDIYSLFSNLLDNAIEYLKTVENAEKRFIRLYIKPQGEMLIIHQENYYGGDACVSGQLPRTTKNDEVYHGFGLKSMLATAKKYGGDLKISTDDGLFKVDIYIQIKK